MTTAPSSARIAETVLLPDATPPVSPTRVMGVILPHPAGTVPGSGPWPPGRRG